MDGEPGEINLLLPLAFGLVLFVFLLFGGLICWLLVRCNVVRLNDRNFPFKIAKGAALSLIGVFAFLVIFNLIIFVIEAAIGFFKK